MAETHRLEAALGERAQKAEGVVYSRKQTSETLCKVLEEYSQLIGLLNKRVLYLDHLISVREKAQ